MSVAGSSWLERASAVLVLVVAQATQPAAPQPAPVHDGPTFADDGFPLATVYRRDDYGEHDQNWDVLQGDNGLIYVANGHGLMEWDGERWRTWYTPSKTRLRQITAWRDGRIYTGTPNDLGYYAITDSGGLAYHSLIDDWSDDARNFGEVWSVAANDEWVVFVTVDHLFVYDGTSVHTVPDIAPGTYRVFNVDDRILIKRQKSPDLLELTRTTGFELSAVSSALPAESFPMAIYVDGDGWIIVTAVHGILRVDGQGSRVLHAPATFADGAVLYSSLIGEDGYHYVGTLKHGLYVINPAGQLVRNLRQDQGLGSNTVLAIAADDQGNLWLSGAPAITRMAPTHRLSRHVTEDDAQQLDFVLRHQGRLFLAGFGFYEMSPGAEPLAPPSFRVIDGTINNQIWAAISVGEDLLLATNGGVVRMRVDDAFGVETEEVIAASAFAYDLGQVPGQDIFYASTHDGLHRIEKRAEGTWHSIQIPGVDRAMRQLEIETPDVVWVASEDTRLFRVSNIDPVSGEAMIQRFDRTDGLGDSKVFPFLMDGRVHFGSPNGLLVYEAEASPPFQANPQYADLLPSAHAEVTLFLQDAQGRIWIEAGGSRYVAIPDGDGWRIDRDLFAMLPDRNLNSIFEYSDDQVWLVFEEAGLHTIDFPALTDTASIPPPVTIRSVHELGTDTAHYLGYGPAAIPALTQQDNSIRVRYAMADFRSRSPTEYRTRLLGSSADQWSDWLLENSKDYTLLGGGEYVFQVQARDGSGRLSAPADLSFTVEPPWFLSRPAIAAYVMAALLVLALAVLAGSKWRKRKTQAMQIELRKLVDERTQALERANSRLEQLANSDGLTGLANRRQFDAVLKRLVGAVNPVTLMLIDVDHFKQYNDAHGHLAGDDLLKSLARTLNAAELPGAALVARYGGEEFAIVLPDSDEQSAAQFAGELRERVQQDLKVTVSIGIGHLILADESAIAKLIQAADHALYAAKQAGRNQVISMAS